MRFYFDVRDRLAIRDGVGRDLGSVSQAVSHAKYLAADMRCLEPDIRPRLSIQGNRRGQPPNPRGSGLHLDLLAKPGRDSDFRMSCGMHLFF